MDWAYVLVIILSIFLALFLLLGIVLVVLLIKVTLQIKKVTTSAEKTASSIQSLVGNVSRFGSPLLVGKALFNQAKKFKKRKD
jgi:hypothetical protein